MPKTRDHICHLCGKAIDYDVTAGDLQKTEEHIPPKQFFPKQMRGDIRGQLLKLPSHKGCNGSFKLDEEYFIHTYCPHVDPQCTSGRQLIEDIRRRTESKGKQSHKLLAMIEKEFSDITPGGINLPHAIVVHSVNAPRIDRVIRKVLQGLHYHEENSFLPHETPMWINLYDKSLDMPEYFYKIFCETGSCRGIFPKIFSYRFTHRKNYAYWSMRFWDSLQFCIVFESV